MNEKILIASVITGMLITYFSAGSIDSSIFRIIDGALLGAASGVLVYMDKCNEVLMYIVSGLSSILFSLSGIVFFAASNTATFGSLIIMGFVIPVVLFWALTRT